MAALTSIISNTSFKHKHTVSSGVLFLKPKLSIIHSILTGNEVKQYMF